MDAEENASHASPMCVYDLEESRVEGMTSVTLHARGMDEGLGHAAAYLIGENRDVEFCAYHHIHPYEDHHIIRITTDDDPDGSRWRAAWKGAWSGLLASFDRVRTALERRRPDPRAPVRVTGDAHRIRISMSTPPVVANVLRRYVLSEVPAHAFTRFEVFRNNTNISDEQLIHRIGQLPIRVSEPPGGFLEPPEVTACVDVHLPAVRDQTERMSDKWVDSADLSFESGASTIVRTGGCSSPVFPLVALAPGGGLKLKACAEIGTGSRHARFSSAIQSHYTVRREDGGSKLWVDISFDMIGQLESRKCVGLAVGALDRHCRAYQALPPPQPQPESGPGRAHCS
jgi:DNA-directed RNA polymerase subunit L